MFALRIILNIFLKLSCSFILAFCLSNSALAITESSGAIRGFSCAQFEAPNQTWTYDVLLSRKPATIEMNGFQTEQKLLTLDYKKQQDGSYFLWSSDAKDLLGKILKKNNKYFFEFSSIESNVEGEKIIPCEVVNQKGNLACQVLRYKRGEDGDKTIIIPRKIIEIDLDYDNQFQAEYKPTKYGASKDLLNVSLLTHAPESLNKLGVSWSVRESRTGKQLVSEGYQGEDYLNSIIFRPKSKANFKIESSDKYIYEANCEVI